MSKDKISAQDIIDSLAAKADITKILADDFFKAFIATIEEALLANDVVKIKALGTFKLNWIAPRKSVNVQTGEDILIDGFYKVVFTPEKELKELVNKPFAHLEPVVLDDDFPKKEIETELNPLASLTEQADEIKGLLSEIQSMPAKKADKVETERKEKEEAVEMKEDKEEKQVCEPIVVEIVKRIEEDEPEKEKKTWLWILLTLVLLIGIWAALYFACMPVRHWTNKTFLGHDTAAYNAATESESASTDDLFKEEEAEKAGKTETVPGTPVLDDFEKAFEKRFENRNVIAKVELGNGNRLAFLAEKYYGSPFFWVYIYEANTDRISNPDKVLVGTIVTVPKIDPMLIDLKNPRSMEKALELRKKYLK